jgi:hypothetical protein
VSDISSLAESLHQRNLTSD